MSYENKLKEVLKISGFYEQIEKSIESMTSGVNTPLGIEVDKHFNVNELIDSIVIIFKKELTEDDLDNIIKFYNTSAGKKILTINSSGVVNSAVEFWLKKKYSELINEFTNRT